MMSDRQWTKATADEAARVLSEHFAGRDVTVEYKSGKYGTGYAVLSFTFSRTDEDGEALTPAREDFERLAFMYDGLKPEDFGRVFYNRGQAFTICGLKPRSPKYPILAKNEAGQTYKFPADLVVRALLREGVRP